MAKRKLVPKLAGWWEQFNHLIGQGVANGEARPKDKARPNGEAKQNGKARPKDKAWRTARRGEAEGQGRTAKQKGKAEQRGEEWFISWGELRFLTIKICIAIKN